MEQRIQSSQGPTFMITSFHSTDDGMSGSEDGSRKHMSRAILLFSYGSRKASVITVALLNHFIGLQQLNVKIQ